MSKDSLRVEKCDLEIGQLLREYRNALYTAFEIVQKLQEQGYERQWLTASAPRRFGFGSSNSVIDVFKLTDKSLDDDISCRIRLEIR